MDVTQEVLRMIDMPQNRRHWYLRSHNGVEPCSSCGFFKTLEEAQRSSADGQVTKKIFHVREVS